MTARASQSLLKQFVQGAHLHYRVERVLLDILDSIQDSLLGGPANSYITPIYLDAAIGTLSGPGALPITTSRVHLTTTGAGDAVTLVDGTLVGQVLAVHHLTDGGDADITPANFADGTSINTAAAGDEIVFMWTGTDWQLIGQSGVTAIT
jgi:hypothetical protein